MATGSRTSGSHRATVVVAKAAPVVERLASHSGWPRSAERSTVATCAPTADLRFLTAHLAECLHAAGARHDGDERTHEEHEDEHGEMFTVADAPPHVAQANALLFREARVAV